jgi:hypothetical protein
VVFVLRVLVLRAFERKAMNFKTGVLIDLLVRVFVQQAPRPRRVMLGGLSYT